MTRPQSGAGLTRLVRLVLGVQIRFAALLGVVAAVPLGLFLVLSALCFLIAGANVVLWRLALVGPRFSVISGLLGAALAGGLAAWLERTQFGLQASSPMLRPLRLVGVGWAALALAMLLGLLAVSAVWCWQRRAPRGLTDLPGR